MRCAGNQRHSECRPKANGDVIAVIESDGAHLLEIQHCLDMDADGVHRSLQIFFGSARAQANSLFKLQTGGDIAIQRIMRAGLIRKQVGDDPPFDQFGKNFRAFSPTERGAFFWPQTAARGAGESVCRSQ
jgi:hypothetical protein